MSFTPINQVRLTNVAYVRLSKHGKRFEIACYRNKVVNWRNKIETDIGEVLQVDTIFTNVSKGLLASKQDIIDCFGTSDHKTACLEILENGELQVSEQERQAMYESMFRDIASIVSDKAVNPENNRPYTISMIQNAMRQIHYAVHVSKSAKQQALEVIRKLKSVMPIARAHMMLRIVCESASDLNKIRESLFDQDLIVSVEKEEANNVLPVAPTATSGTAVDTDTLAAATIAAIQITDATDIDVKSTGATSTAAGVAAGGNSRYLEIRVEPEAYRKIEVLVAEVTKGSGRVDVLQLRVAVTPGTTSNTSTPPVNIPPSSSSATDAKEKEKEKEKERSNKSNKKSSTTKVIVERKQPSSLVTEDNNNNNSISGRLGERVVTGIDDDEEDGAEEEEDTDAEAFLKLKNKRKAEKKKKKKQQDHRVVAPETEASDLSEDESHPILTGGSTGATSPIDDTAAAAGTSSTLLHSQPPVSDQQAAAGIQPQPLVPQSQSQPQKKLNKKDKLLLKEEQREKERKVEEMRKRTTGGSTKLEATRDEHSQDAATPTDSSSSSSVTAIEAASPSPSPLATGNNSQAGAVAVAGGDKGKFTCNTCGGLFPDAASHRTHFKSDWHRHNLKRKMKGLSTVNSEQAFNALPVAEVEI